MGKKASTCNVCQLGGKGTWVTLGSILHAKNGHFPATFMAQVKTRCAWMWYLGLATKYTGKKTDIQTEAGYACNKREKGGEIGWSAT